MPLTDIAVRNAKPTDKAQKLSDAGGLYLMVHPNGSKYWRLKYRILGKEKVLAIGIYPQITLSDARARREEAKKLLANGQDPSEVKQTLKAEAKLEAANTFEAVAREWLGKKAAKQVDKTRNRNLRILELNIFKHIGDTPINKVTSKALLAALHKMEQRGIGDSAHRALQICGEVFRYAIATERAQADLSLVLKGALAPVKEKHHASITDAKGVADLLRSIHVYEGSFLTQQALKLAPLVFVRPGELRNAEWSEIDLEAGEWRIAAHKMKMKAVHIIPLSKQAIEIFKEIKAMNGNGKYVFPGIRSTDRPMSDNTVNAALRRLGFEKGEMTG
ncbi:MAG: integrase arm-type DNA-binding domain-containing protein, partial [Bacteroidia bacterium]|nr:integrase arm-type DNA-binding domain-containing protein [Methylotenera sp.]